MSEKRAIKKKLKRFLTNASYKDAQKERPEPGQSIVFRLAGKRHYKCGLYLSPMGAVACETENVMWDKIVEWRPGQL